MEMKFVKTVMDLAGIKTAYKLGKLVECSTQLIDTWIGNVEGKFPEGMKVRFLCKLRQISTLSWNQFGKLLDDEYLDKKKDKK
jgi:hypothetical protein